MAAHSSVTDPLVIAEIIARSVRDAVHTAIDDPSAGEATGVAASGDTTFSVDKLAEAALERAVSDLGIPLAFYSEDEGLRGFGAAPQWLLIVDPIDGTRPAAAGLDSCVVSVAVARMSDEPRFSDVVAGAVYELRRERMFLAAKGGGAVEISGATRRDLHPRPPREFCELRWTIETVARPAVPNFMAAAPLIDETSLRGGLFALSSSAYALCQVAAGRFSGMVDLSARIFQELDPAAEYMRRVGHGRIMGLWAYDIAAAALIAIEAGCAVTDAWGRPIDDIRLTRTLPEDMASCVCSSDKGYHSRMMELLNDGFRSYRECTSSP